MGTLFIHPTPKTYTVYRDPLSGTHITGNSVHGPSTHLRDLIWGPILGVSKTNSGYLLQASIEANPSFKKIVDHLKNLFLSIYIAVLIL